MMNADRVETTLNHIRKIYSRVLDDSVNNVIPKAIAGLKTSKQAYDRNRGSSSTSNGQETWGYTIDHEEPLRFKTSATRDIGLGVDVYCDIRWSEGVMPITQNIKVRIWSDHEDTIFQKDRDAKDVLDRLSHPSRTRQERVVSRFHLDKVSKDHTENTEYHPEYHLQFGGKPEDYELCWHPKKVNVPRLLYHPMELFLTCQMVAANFFWKDYLEIREKSEYRTELFMYQESFLESYYTYCLEAIRNKDSMLDELGVS